ncbi:hypothetical protein TNCT_736631 [Trichonephila clavata]|uniref:Uncharacterized protein n=1 Tax=Trichonephila clavata TaxID=2740835 RepID=A0A8X6KAR8_TRICU|nr:hypothetical protein TNCT_736631 [Trichonephila clavata]
MQLRILQSGVESYLSQLQTIIAMFHVSYGHVDGRLLRIRMKQAIHPVAGIRFVNQALKMTSGCMTASSDMLAFLYSHDERYRLYTVFFEYIYHQMNYNFKTITLFPNKIMQGLTWQY